jgi:CRP-like cAMP-binding protein
VRRFFSDNASPSTEDNLAQIELCKSMSYESFHRGDVIMQQGDASNHKLYIILTGSVNVVIDFTPANTKEKKVAAQVAAVP